jgi:heme exporter protein D
MDTANHIGFIVASYAAAAMIVAPLVAWVVFDFRTQRRSLADLESRGATRRSATAQAGPAKAQAREDA